MKVLWTGAAGFIAGYAIEKLLSAGHEVIGIDNYSKYGEVEKSYDVSPQYTFVEGDAKDAALMRRLAEQADVLVTGAAMIGGVAYLHEHAYDLLLENERLTATAFDTAIWAKKYHKLKKIVVMSSSMVFGSTAQFPTPEHAMLTSPPPQSVYGFQKLACEYYAQAAWEQYALPYTIIRPFNCVGVGERRAINSKKVLSGNIELALGHVIPDLVQKIVKGQDPLHILGSGEQVRCFTYAGDLAEGIRLCIEHEKATNNDFNISANHETTILELAEIIWRRLKGNEPFNYVADKPYAYDVQTRIPDTSKAKRILGFEATTTLDEILDEVVPWVKNQVTLGNI